MSAFALLAYFILGFMVLAAGGVFFYEQLLIAQLNETKKEINAFEQQETQLEAKLSEFIRLKDRLSSGKALLASHVSISQFFTRMERVLPVSSRLLNVQVAVNQDGSISLKGSGEARDFTALALVSEAFAHSGGINDVIFSHFQIKPTTVAFDFSGTIDPKLVQFMSNEPPPATSTEETDDSEMPLDETL